MANPIIDLGSKVEDNIIVIFANNLSAILYKVCKVNVTFSISSLIGYIFYIKSTLYIKKGLIKRVNSK
jgi:hypothetical protein